MGPFRSALNESPLKSIRANFGGCKGFQQEASNYIKSLPMTLERLELVLSNIDFATSNEFAAGLGQLGNLTSISLVLAQEESHAQGLNCASCLWEELGLLSQLKLLYINLRGNKSLHTIDGLAARLDNLLCLEDVRLNVVDCSVNEDEMLQLCKGLESRPSLLSMRLELQWGTSKSRKIFRSERNSKRCVYQ